MQQIHILAAGKLKERWMAQACAEYQKRASAFFKLSVTELDECRLPDSPSPAQIEKALMREAENFCKQLPKQCLTIALCVEGDAFSSPALACLLEQAAVRQPCAAFLIGSSHGMSKALKKEADIRLSFSPMTFPHQLMRVMLLEQLYRCGSIIHGGKYHK